MLRSPRAGATASAGTGSDEPPLRAQPFSAEEMEQLGGRLARTHRLSATRGPDLLLARLRDNQRVLSDNCARLAGAVRAQRQLTPAGEWLLDNAHLIEEQMRTARRHLPRDYSRELPRLATGASIGLPRVYDLALEAISHGDGRVDAESLNRFVAAYQSVVPLKLGELWAIPIMLRLALIENLRRVSARVAQDRVERDIADDWADRMIAIAEADPKNLVLEIADMARSNPPQSSSFVAEIARRLQGQSSVLATPLNWIEQWLADEGQSIEQMVQGENQQQAADQVSISNSIGSLRFLSTMDWRVFVEAQSQVERTLEQDPAGAYARMDFATRDSYRHAIEALAKRSRKTEGDVVTEALALARAGHDTDSPAVTTHIGYYLIDAGRRELEHCLGLRHVLRVRDKFGRVPLAYFLLPIALLTSLLTASLLLPEPMRLPHLGLGFSAAMLAALVFSETAIALTNWFSTRLARPSVLPRMNYARGIAAESRTLVVVPTMLSSAQSIADLVELLEVRFLANRDAQLRFALLTDYLDAAHEHQPDDGDLLAYVQTAIEMLNGKYPAHSAGTNFYLFHRPRRFNPRQGTWMGHERKRGKLAELNALLRNRDGARAKFERIVGDIESLADVEYVITLDSDTQLPRDSAREFAATLAHPLNRPQFDPRLGCVTRGYAILQPRVGVSLAGGPRTRYAQLYGSEPGIDPYTRAVSDVYQDLFDEGSFVGKGIYAVDAFEQALAGRFPENAVLSHDLLEGCFARAGLVSDVQLYEDYPSSYALDVNRRHRWVRGDWQLLPWLLPRVPRENGSWSRNPLSALSRWKLFDNLRRSLVAPATVALLWLGWAQAARPGVWTLWVLATLLLQPVLATLVELLSKPKEMPFTAHVSLWWSNARDSAQRWLLALACLPFEAAFSLDAIARTLWRLTFSRRQLLEWQPSSEAQRSVARTFGALARRMAGAPITALLTAAALALLRPESLLVAAPLLLLWWLGPWLMWSISRNVPRRSTELRTDQALFLRRLARRTWNFFEIWVDSDNNHLPPDNVQHRPQTKVAHRTSPTNIGLSLLANLAAHDFGYLTTSELLARTTATLDTLDRLPRHRGHFLNWYDTQALTPLLPEYVSTVDSGNLVGHLLTLRQGLLELTSTSPNDGRVLRGLADTVDVLIETAGGHVGSEPREFAADVHALTLQRPPTLDALGEALAALRKRLPKIVAELAGSNEDTSDWLVALRRGLEAAQGEVADVAQAEADGSLEAQLRARRAEIERLAERIEAFAQMDFEFLYDPARHLLAIGYHVADRRLDGGCYDLLASEARLASFVAIAQGQLPQETWFALSRLLNGSDGPPVLLSWSGSMFEYLMPQLVMPSYPGTLLDETGRAAVERQIAYAHRRGVAWGISESGYNTVDAQMNYQYRAFGVPSLGLQRGLAQELVIAPYASMLGLMVDPAAACVNLERLVTEGVGGRFGLFEAIDYTPARLPPGDTRAIVYSHMAHHQGMGLLALAYAMLDQPMQRRFTADPALQATLLLLQERIPRTAAFHSHASELPGADVVPDQVETRLRVFHNADAGLPAVQMLSNGRYHVMVTSGGGGYSRLREMAITRWREDPTREHWGAHCFLRDVASGNYWSTALQPTGIAVENYEAIFSDAKAEFRGRRENYDTHLEIAVSPEHDIELRRLRITNRARTRRTIEITTYAEVVLAPAIADELHPAFSNLFVQTMLVPDKQAIVCTRRPRASDEAPHWMLHLVAVHDADIEEISYETDRARFIGRGNTLATPAAMTDAASLLSNAQGSVLDPVVAIRCRISLAPEQTVTLDMVTGVSEDAVGCHGLIDKYRDRRLADRVFDLAWTHSQVVRRQLNASQADAQLYERLAGLVLYSNPAMRAEKSLQLLNRRGQPGLWAHAISGDFPIVLLKIADTAHIDLVRQLVQAHAYWRLKGLAVDLVIWNEDQAGYRQQLNDQIMGLIAAGLEANVVDRPGG
ncbi:MAG: glucoamylase family protein, partial [Lysobacterales bacterium]